MNKTQIEWTDFTANPIRFRDKSGKVVWGCVKTSPGCANCYAEAMAKRFRRGGPFTAEAMKNLHPFLDEDELDQMLRTKLAAGKRCFVGDMTDVFGEWVPDDMLDRLFAVMALRKDVTWQVLTKRAERMAAYFNAPSLPDRLDDACGQFVDDPGFTGNRIDGSFEFPRRNVWLGVSVENQAQADERIPHLLRTPAAVRFLSAEPLLGPVKLSPYVANSRTIHFSADIQGMLRNRAFDGLTGDNGQPLSRADAERELRALHAKGVKLISCNSKDCVGFSDQTGCPGHPKVRLDWVIAGGESGPGARACSTEWVRSIIAQCRATGVACFHKQLGSVPTTRLTDGEVWPGGNGLPECGHLSFVGDGFGNYRVHGLRDAKGGDPSEWPEDLRVREFPSTEVSK